MENKIYTIYDGAFDIKVKAPVKSCLFCSHCTDIFWDYTNGIYNTVCNIQCDIYKGSKGNCKNFENERNKENVNE